MFKGVIFDLDGTILDTKSEWDSLGKNYLISKDIKPEKDIDKILIDMTLKEAGEYFIERYNVKLTVNEIVNEVNSFIEDKYINKFQLKPGVTQYLKKLKSENKKMCVATATEPSLVLAALKRLGVNEYFKFILTCDDVGYSKRYPNIYNESALKLGLEKESVIVYEDTLSCIETAKNAGFNVVGIYHSKEHKMKIEEIIEKSISGFEELL